MPAASFTPAGEMMAQAETIPAQLGIMSTALKHVSAAIPRETWKPGDVLVCNDPFRGCTHTMDIVLFSPVFVGGTLIAVTSTIAHHIDIGGKIPGTEAADNIEVFAEGLILPPLKLLEEGARTRPSSISSPPTCAIPMPARAICARRSPAAAPASAASPSCGRSTRPTAPPLSHPVASTTPRPTCAASSPACRTAATRPRC